MPFLRIMKENISIRKINKTDLGKIMHWRMSADVTQYMFTDPYLTLEQQIKWFNEIECCNTCKYWIIDVNNVDIGVLGLEKIDFVNKRCSWNWYIGETSYRGLGIAQQIQFNVYDYVFNKLKLNRLYSEVLTVNERNLNAYKKCGYIEEGILKEHIIKDGISYDVTICGITKSIWEAIKGNYLYNPIAFEE